MKPYIVCTGTNGRAVVYGYAEEEPVTGQPAKLHRAKMVIYWSRECGGLFGLAQNGPQTDTRITSAVEYTGMDTVAQTLTVSPEAAAMIDEWPAC